MDCPSIPVLDAREFKVRFFDKFREKRIPFTGQMDLTTRCNIRCGHCYISDNQSHGELTYSEILRIMDEIVEEGCLWLVLTGGEPLLRPDFLDIYTYGKKKGLFMVVFTNATLLDERIADYFAELPPYSVEVSLYGASKETYEKVVGVTGAYERAMRGINLLAERRLPLHLKTVATTVNQHEVRDIQNLAERLGAGFRYDPLINPRVDGNKGPCGLRIPPEEVVAMDMADPRRAEALRKQCEMTAGWRRSEYIFDCGAGRKAFNIDAQGRLQVCGLARNYSYDLRQGSFHDGWRHYIAHALDLKRAQPSRCDQCDLVSMCGMCPAWIELENNGVEGPVEYICQIAHLRARAFGVQGPEETREEPALGLGSYHLTGGDC
ncbi:MAG: radical SAM protein [Dehalococcoidia bacterium]|nr:radical SAM protein [Dehalococcoidia bacterium]